MGGTPMHLRCPRCKKYREWDSSRVLYDDKSHQNLVPTGRSKTVSKTGAGLHGVTAVEMKHDGPAAPHIKGTTAYCGHVFWTTHPNGVRKLFPDAKRVGNANARNVRR